MPWTDSIDLAAAETSPGSVFQLPFDFAVGKKTGPRRIRKRILPVGKVAHGGKVLDFSKARLQKIVDNFKKSVFDYVPVNAATEDNRHNENPFLNLGRVSDLVLGKDGLDAVIDLNELGGNLYKNNPLVGASVRFYDDFIRQWDRKFFGPVVRHVCVTQDPHVSGMPPAEVLLSSAIKDGVVDMTNLSTTGFMSTSKTNRKENIVEYDDQATTTEEEVDMTQENEGLYGPQSGLDLSDPMQLDQAMARWNAMAEQVEQVGETLSAREQQHLQADFTNRAFRLVAQNGISPAAINALKPVLTGELGQSTIKVVDMTAQPDQQGQHPERDIALRELLWDWVGRYARPADMSAERGHAVNPYETPQVNRQIQQNQQAAQAPVMTQVPQQAPQGQASPQADLSREDQEYAFLLNASGVQNPKGFSTMPDGTRVPQ